MEAEPGYLTLNRLKERGWTPSMITKLLGNPDRTRKNPHYKKAAPMKLYSLQRIERAETTSNYSALKRLATKRSIVSTKTADKKRQELLREISRITIRVTPMADEELTKAAVNNYNLKSRRRNELATIHSESFFLERIKVNYARHNLTIYDKQLQALFARIGRDEGLRLIRKKVYAAIAAQWPDLAAECRRQMIRRQV